MLSLSVGPNHTKAPGWGISLVHPVIDVISTTIQVGCPATIIISNPDGRVVKASAYGAEDSGLIPSRVEPMTLKIGFHNFPD